MSRTMLRECDQPSVSVAILDDDKYKSRPRFDGVHVRGTGRALAAIAAKCNATDLIVAQPNADAASIRDITERATAVKLHTMVLPPCARSWRAVPPPTTCGTTTLWTCLAAGPSSWIRPPSPSRSAATPSW